MERVNSTSFINYLTHLKRFVLLLAGVLSFTLTVNAQDSNCNVACNDNLNVSLDDDCEGLVTPDMLLEGYECMLQLGFEDEDFKIYIRGDEPGDADQGQDYYISDKGKFIYEIKLRSSVQNELPEDHPFKNWEGCWGYVTGEDKTPPEIDVDKSHIRKACDYYDVQVVQGVVDDYGGTGDRDPRLNFSYYSCFQDVNGTPGDCLQPYDTIGFTVSQDDIYTFEVYDPEPLNGSTEEVENDNEIFIALYQGGFNAGEPCSNIIGQSNLAITDGVVNLSDDEGLDARLRISLELKAGSRYHLLVAQDDCGGSENDDYRVFAYSDNGGKLENSIFGEPESLMVCNYLLCSDVDEVLDVDPRTAEYMISIPEFEDNCSNGDMLNVWFDDELIEGGDCENTEIIRTWYARDMAGNEAEPKTQTIQFKTPNIYSVESPATTVPIECDELTADDLDENGHPKPEVAGFPFVISAFGIHDLNESYCNLGADYKDIAVIEVCDNTVKIIRQWTILDWCDIPEQDRLNNYPLYNYRQIIKVGDFSAPTVTDPGDDVVQVSTSGFDCEGSLTIPDIEYEDNCAAKEDLTVHATLYKKVIVDILNKYGQVIDTREEYQEVGPVTVGEDYGDIEVGTTYKVVYQVEDPCGHISDPVYTLIEAQDDDAPVAVCDDDLHISIGGDGIARITDKDVDEGSWDNCGAVETWVSRKLASEALVDAYLAKVHDGVGYVLSGYDDKDKSSDADIYVKDLDDDGELDDDETEKILRLKDGMWYTWWEKEIYFLCDDIAERVTIELLAEDEGGLTNICWNDVLIEDKIAPYCEAPGEINWDCTELPYGFDPNDDDQLADLFGEASATDNCPDAIAFQISKTVDWDCNSGTITRTFQASDARGLTSNNTCEQTINIARVHNYEMIFPADPEPVVCGEATLGELITNTIACDLLTVNIVNDTFTASGDACYKIKRTYSVINWCEYDGESPAVAISRDEDGNGVTGDIDVYVLRDADDKAYIDDEDEKEEPLRVLPQEDIAVTGHWTYVQYIKVIDNIQPVVEVGGDDVFCSIDNVDCDTEVTIPITVTDDCAGPDVEVKAFVDGVQVDVDGDYPNYSITGDYVIGDHELEVHAVDGCRNSELVVKPFTVADCKAPTPICINGLAIELMPTEDDGGSMAVWVSDFVVSGQEDCSDDPITLSINRVGDTPDITSDGLILTCDDPDTVAVEIYAWDSANNPTAVQPDLTVGGPNYDHCVTYVVVQDNMFNLCDDPGKVGVAGLIANQNNETVENVQVSLSGMMSNSSTTAVDGNYTFNTLTPGGDYTITPYKDDDYLNGVSTFDLVLITKHILGTKRLQGAYNLIAADANSSKSISTLDLIQFRKLILSVSTALPSNTSWRFVPASYQFPDGENPWAQAFPEIVTYNDLQTAIASGDFVAVKIGDVNGNAKANSLLGEQRSIAGIFNLNVADQTLVAGNEYRIAFTAEDLSVQGYQFTLNHEGLELMDIEYGVAKAENFGVVEDGVLTTSWNGTASNNELFTLVVRANANGQLSEMLNVNSRYTRSEAYDAANELLDVALTFNGDPASVELRRAMYELYQNVPNPFQGQTMISFRLPAATQATIKIQDVTGKTLKVIRGDYARGFNQIRVNSSELPSTGVLYYTLETDKFTASRKMVVISE